LLPSSSHDASAMSKVQSFRKTAKERLDKAIHIACALAARQKPALLAYLDLQRHVQNRTSLLSPQGSVGRGGADSLTLFNWGLVNLAFHQADWLRPVESWAIPKVNPLPKFTSLAQHLLAKYPMPGFMTSVWLQCPSQEAYRHQGWFKHLGLGTSIRKADLPLTYTKSMAHWFSQAPDHLTAGQALRWAQIRGLDGSERLAETVVATRLAKVFANEDFWLTLLHFFVSHPKMDLAHVGPLIDFLQHERFTPQEVFEHGVLVKKGPPQPKYSLKGRTLESLLRQMARWHERLGKDSGRPIWHWTRCNIGEYEIVEGSENMGNMRRWTIEECLNSKELEAEGRAQRHCVATYAEKCAKRQTSIWSLRVENDLGRKPVLTIEVDPPTRTICQIRGRGNRLPKDHEREIIRLWAIQERLRMAVQ